MRGYPRVADVNLPEKVEGGAFTDLTDVCERTRLPIRLIENLIQAGALDDWGMSRRDLIWQLGTVCYETDVLDLDLPDDDVDLPDLTRMEQLDMEYRALGLSTGQHIMTYYREWLDAHDILSREGLTHAQHGRGVRVAGLVIIRQAPPTAKGYQFLTLKDEEGFINIILRPRIYERYKHLLRSTALLIVNGQVQIEQSVVNVIAGDFYALNAVLQR